MTKVGPLADRESGYVHSLFFNSLKFSSPQFGIMHLYEKINSRIQLSSYIGMVQDIEKVLLKCQYIRKQLNSVNSGGLYYQ